MTVLPILGGNVTIIGENFGPSSSSPIVTIEGQSCDACQVFDGVSSPSVIFCQLCPGGPANISHHLTIAVNSLVSDTFEFYYEGIEDTQ